MNDATKEAAAVLSGQPEPPPGVAELMKLYESVEEMYVLAAAASGSYEEQSATTSYTDFRLKAK